MDDFKITERQAVIDGSGTIIVVVPSQSGMLFTVTQAVGSPGILRISAEEARQLGKFLIDQAKASG